MLLWYIILSIWMISDQAQSEELLDNHHLAYKLQYFSNVGDKNFVISPYSVELALYMLYNAMSPNRQSAQRMIHRGFAIQPHNISAINDYFDSLRELPSKITSPEYMGETVLQALVILGVNKPHQIIESYKDKMKAFFEDNVEPVINANFAIEGKDLVRKINEKVYEFTNGMIENILQENSLHATTMMFMVNAVYLSADWSTDITFSDVQPNSKFYNIRGRQTSVTMFSGNMDVPYYENHEVQVVKLPLHHHEDPMQLGMYVVLPKIGQSLTALAKKGILKTIPNFKNLPLEYVNVTLPEFDIDYASNLIDTLRRMDMYDLSPRNSRSISPFDVLLTKYNRQVFVNKIQHKASIKVSQLGIRAAAATANTLIFTIAGDEADKTFLANRPFLFYVTARNHGTLYSYEHFLFSGQYTGIDN